MVEEMIQVSFYLSYNFKFQKINKANYKMLTATSNTIVVEMVDKKAKLLGGDSFSKTNVNQ